MERIFISELLIENVRHLKNIQIPLSNEEMKHLILTGKNGSGKTSVLEALSRYLNAVSFAPPDLLGCGEGLEERGAAPSKMIQKKREDYHQTLRQYGLDLKFNHPENILSDAFQKGEFIIAFYKADRIFSAEVSNHIEKIELRNYYSIAESPREMFVKYLADLKVTEALARTSGKSDKADAIKEWFRKFQDLLRKIFNDDSLELLFEEDSFTFSIKEKNKNIFNFNTLSSGFASVLDIVADLIIRMEKKTNRSFDFNIPGIVLIDEIETHLHIELQKSILELLTTVFPNIQFIMSTHSPFILNSISNAVIYDLENNTLVKDGLSNVPYGGIVEGYFNANEMSASLEEKFERYKVLVHKENLTDDDFEEIAELEMFLNEIPDYLALNITTEYQRLKMEFERRNV